MIIALGTIVVAFALRRRAPVASFGLFWFISRTRPVSNMLDPHRHRDRRAHAVSAERRSRARLSAARVLARDATRAPRARSSWRRACGVLIALGLWKSIDRQKVWKNNDILFDMMVIESPNNYRAHILRGRNLALKKPPARGGARSSGRASASSPTTRGHRRRGGGYRRAGLCEPAIPLYEWSFAMDSTYRDGRLGYVYCLSTKSRWADTREQALAGAALRRVLGREVSAQRGLRCRFRARPSPEEAHHRCSRSSFGRGLRGTRNLHGPCRILQRPGTRTRRTNAAKIERTTTCESRAVVVRTLLYQ